MVDESVVALLLPDDVFVELAALDRDFVWTGDAKIAAVAFRRQVLGDAVTLERRAQLCFRGWRLSTRDAHHR